MKVQRFDRWWCGRVLRLTLTTLCQTTRVTLPKTVISKHTWPHWRINRSNYKVQHTMSLLNAFTNLSSLFAAVIIWLPKFRFIRRSRDVIFQFDRKLSTITHPFLALPSGNSIKIIMMQVTLAWLSSPSVTQTLMAPHSLLERILLAQNSLQTQNELTELFCRNTTSAFIDQLSSRFTARKKLSVLIN
jgi:hypothetical protein